ncbi:hypothetical protein [Mastigocoleus testarum]|uniref:DUF11 domain-containing protein n=1 Tax=Mastigocoleus testarum BC008 TaxID=371196 RepID=A0A0V7ZE19_9CYAN|nr:hypothetical protein [Mastigocoleus testarum]KST62731.1 hypothetical protein BC008_38565 [Mastigocoleus testarum BC008]
MGSSTVGVGNGDILLYKPATVTGDVAKEFIPNTADFSCNTDQLGRGKIQNRTEELAGPKPVSGGDNPNVLLVKRITSINSNITSNGGDNLSIYNQDDSDHYDDNVIEGANPPTQPHKDTDKWPNTSGKDSSSFLIGGINGGKVKPGDDIEYTIYFLSTGKNEAKKVLFCDRVPEHTTFIPAAFNSFSTQAPNGSPGVPRGILWQYNDVIESLTNTQDGDAGQYFPPGVEPTTVYPDIDCGGNNSNGAVVVDLGDLPNAIAPGTPTGSYGFVRFGGKVK